MIEQGEPLADRCLRVARAAIAPLTCELAVMTRSPIRVRIDDVPGQAPLTAPQRAAAKAAAEAVDPRPRRPRGAAAIAADVEVWIGVDLPRLRKVAALALALAMQQRHGVARAAGIPVSGDEVDL